MNNCVNCDDCSHRSETCLCDISRNEDECPLVSSMLSEEYNEAIIGQSTNGNIIYDYDKVVECVSKYLHMNNTDAKEYINKNVEPTLIYYSEPPIMMYDINKYDLLL